MIQVHEVEKIALAEICEALSTSKLREIEQEYLGKQGKITSLMKLMGTLPPAERPALGLAVNSAKLNLENSIKARKEILENQELAIQFESEKIDITMPARRLSIGNQHVLYSAMLKVKQLLGGMGFEYSESPDLEKFKYNFDVLNYPPDHPAMDDQDTFYIDDEHVMRTQTTSLQGYILETRKPPFRIFTTGRCYRNETVDRTHGHTFHQVDAFMVDEGISMAHLKGTLNSIALELFGEQTITRFRPDFFPFVEPGVDFAISSPKFQNGKWLELGGAGLIHPNILERYGIDTKKFSGFAFGLGLERMPMLRYGIDDLRYFFENDKRFLSQFSSL